MIRTAHVILGVVIALIAGKSLAEVDTQEYFAFARGGWGGSYLFLSKSTCALNARDVTAYNKAALAKCELMGGKDCAFTGKLEPAWKKGTTVETRHGQIRFDFCWREVSTHVEGGAPFIAVASCQHGVFGNPDQELVCSHTPKESFMSTSVLQAPPPPPAADFE